MIDFINALASETHFDLNLKYESSITFMDTCVLVCSGWLTDQINIISDNFRRIAACTSYPKNTAVFDKPLALFHDMDNLLCIFDEF